MSEPRERRLADAVRQHQGPATHPAWGRSRPDSIGRFVAFVAGGLVASTGAVLAGLLFGCRP